MNVNQIFRDLAASILFATFLFSCNTEKPKTVRTENPETLQPIMVYSAASLTDVLSELIDSFESQHPVEIKTNMASSGTLARQIEQGGEPDVYISANKGWANYVDSLRGFFSGTKTVLAKNELVLIAPKNSPLQEADIDSTFNLVSALGKSRLSIGDPAHVPAGKYAGQSLQHYGWYDVLKGKALPAKDVRSALMVVEMEEAPLGIVFHTDAKKSNRIKILHTFPDTSHETIEYVGGVCKDNVFAKIFFEYLNADASEAIWTKHGFKK